MKTAKNTIGEKILNSRIKLRPYQERGIQKMRELYAQGKRRIIFWLATGGGKTITFNFLANQLVEVGNKKVIIVVKRRSLIFQTQKSFEGFTGKKASIIMGNEKGFDASLPVQICSIDTINRRMEKPEYQFLKNFDWVIVDECHDATSPSYVNFLTHFKNKPWIGFTATPFPVANKYLEDWEDVIEVVTSKELRDTGYLVPDVTYAPAKIDTIGIKTKRGDFDLEELAKRASESKIVGDIVDNWKKYGENRSTILFAVNIQHSAMMAYAFRQAGIPAVHQDQSHNQTERDQAISDLKSGKVKILCSVNIYSTGTDIPEIGCVISARPTKSEVLYVQQVGRGLRPCKICASCGATNGADPKCKKCGCEVFSFEKKDCIFLDHADNSSRFGLPYFLREPKIRKPKDKKKSNVLKNEVPIITCEKCFMIYEPTDAECPGCGHVNEKKERVVKQEEGVLEKKEYGPIEKLELESIKEDLNALKVESIKKNWKPNAKYIKLYTKHGYSVFKYHKELDFPLKLKWVLINNIKR